MSDLAIPHADRAEAPRHRIHRLELQIQTSDQRLGKALLPRLSRLHHERLAPLLERICDELSPDGPRHRLQTLELDLGTLDLEQLDDQCVVRLEAGLRQALAERLPLVSSRPAPAAARANSKSPSSAGSDCDAPPTLAASDDLELLATFAATGDLPWWAPRNAPNLIADALTRWLPTASRSASAAPGKGGNAEATQALLLALARVPSACDRLRHAVRPELQAQLAAAIAAIAPESQAEASVGSRMPVDRNGPVRRDSSGTTAVAGTRDQQATTEPRYPPALALPKAQRLAPTRTSAQLQPSLTPPPPRRRGASDGEWLIDGAGLVLLWPFLETCCNRLRLLDANRQFVGEPERQRAMALFGLLADDAPEPMEWQLSLAKVLCGVPPDHPWTLDAPLRVDERQELERPLVAALAHADGLLGEDPQALRQRFLLRPGLLTHQPNGWLLQVDQRDGDEVLSQLPWSLQWLRLAWMVEGVQVHW